MNIGLILFTCNRPQYAEITLRAALRHIKTTHRLSVHIADDGSPASDMDALREIAVASATMTGGLSFTNADHGGYGKSYNLATQVMHEHCEILLPCEDDWELLRDLDLDPLVEALSSSEDARPIECIRMGYLGWTQALRGELVRVADQPFLLFHPSSDEPHIFAGHPRLETRRFEREVGPWPEGLDAGSTEMAVAKRPDARRGVAWPMDLVHARGDLWAHIGQYQARTDQRHDGEAAQALQAPVGDAVH